MFEAVQVEEKGAEGLPLAPRAVERVAQPFQEERAIGQAGESVVKDGVDKPLLRLLALGDVEGDPDGARDGTPAGPQRLHVGLEHPASPLHVVVHGFAVEGPVMGGNGRETGILSV